MTESFENLNSHAGTASPRKGRLNLQFWISLLARRSRKRNSWPRPSSRSKELQRILSRLSPAALIVQTETLRLRRIKMSVIALFLFSFVFFSTIELGQVKHIYSTVRSFHPSRYGIQLVLSECSVNAQHLVDTPLWDNMSECVCACVWVCVCVCVWERETETLQSPY